MEVSERQSLIVKCKECGTLNRKGAEDYRVICRKCKAKLAFYVLPPWATPPQPKSLLLQYNEEMKE